MIYNQEDYNSEKYGEESSVVSRTANYHYVSMDRVQPFLEVHKLEEHQIDSDENYFNPGWFGTIVLQYFYLNDKSVSAQSTQYYVGGVIIEMDINLHEHKRSIYNLLDFLGDVGGLREALISIGQLFFMLFGQRGLQGFLAGKLFWQEAPKHVMEKASNAETILASQQRFVPKSKHFCLRIFCCFNCSKKRQARWRMQEKADKVIGEQLDIVRVIRRQILLDQLLKIILSPTERHYLKRSKNFTLRDGDVTDSSSSATSSFESKKHRKIQETEKGMYFDKIVDRLKRKSAKSRPAILSDPKDPDNGVILEDISVSS